MAESVITVEHLSKRFRVYHQRSVTFKEALVERGRARYEEFWAVRDVSYSLEPGTTLGVIGENGSGKSTLLKCVAGILVPDEGTVRVRGRLASLLEVGAGFHPEYSGRENIYLNGAILGLPRRYINSVIDEIVGFAELERFIDNPVRTYSSGMYTRLGFSIAVHLDPDILLVDEVLAVGDEAFQRRCLERIEEMRAEGRTLMFVSHGMESVRNLCDACLWIDSGVARMYGDTKEVVDAYLTEVDRREAAALARTATASVESAVGRNGIRITSVGYSGRRGSTNQVNTGEPFSVHVGYTSPTELRGVRVRLSFAYVDGPGLLSVTTDDTTAGTRPWPAVGAVSLSVPQLPFLEGLYCVSVELTDITTGDPLIRLDRVQPFRVHSPGRREAGVALPGHSWTLPGIPSKPVKV